MTVTQKKGGDKWLEQVEKKNSWRGALGDAFGKVGILIQGEKQVSQ